MNNQPTRTARLYSSAVATLQALSVPFDLWPAYRTGVIDATGRILVPPQQRTPQQRDALTMFDLLVLRLCDQARGDLTSAQTQQRIKLLTAAAAHLLGRDTDSTAWAVCAFVRRCSGQPWTPQPQQFTASDAFHGITLLSEQDGGAPAMSVGAGIGGPNGNPGDGSALAGPMGASIFTKQRRRKAAKKQLRESQSLEVAKDKDYLKMGFKEFDQSPNSPWRALAHDHRYSEAADMIEQYLQRAPVAQKLDGYEKSTLIWHAGQMYAYAGKTSDAIKAMQQSMTFVNDQYWNDYANGTIAFLKNDKKTLEAIIKSGRLNKDDLNYKVLSRLLSKFGKPYKDAY